MFGVDGVRGHIYQYNENNFRYCIDINADHGIMSGLENTTKYERGLIVIK